MIKASEILLKHYEALIASKIIRLRGERVMLDFHLAELYQVETRVLKQAVRRNIDRFPNDFMFELTDNEINEIVSQNVIPSKKIFGGAIPFAFTENGVAMLSSVLNSKKSIEINIAIMRTFTLLRRMLEMEDGFVKEVEKIKKIIYENQYNIHAIFKFLDQFDKARQEELDFQIRRKIGYRQSGKK
jgi:hypothetical protein